MTDIKIICAPNPNPNNCVKVMHVKQNEMLYEIPSHLLWSGWIPTALDIKC